MINVEMRGLDQLLPKINGDPVGPLQARVELWAARYGEIVTMAKVHFGAGIIRLKWELGTTEVHCETCKELAGIVANAEDWEASGFHPRCDLLECGGFNCDCSLKSTKEPVTEKQPGDVQGAE